MTRAYKMAYTEVLEIIKHLPSSEIKKIPNETVEFFEKNKDNNYNFTYDVNETLENQNVLRETNIIILKLFNQFFMTDEQNIKFKHILNYNEQEHQKELESIYDPNNVFDNKTPQNSEINLKEKAIVEIKQEGLIKKIIKKIRNIFGR